MENKVKGYIALVLSEGSRSRLSELYPPTYPDFIGHHITYQFPAWSTDALPEISSAEVVGIVANGVSLEAFIVKVDGTTTRNDGDTYHITWSLDKSAGIKPKDSNALIKAEKPTNIDPELIKVTPTFIKF
jgi:hypothetical protein